MTRPPVELKCSIVMATYNKSQALDWSLRSIRQQNVPFDYEVIVVDDGSSDQTKHVCDKYSVRYAHLDRPFYANPARARNIGLRMARGEVIIQQCEVIHHTADTIARLVNRLEPGFFDIAATWNAAVVDEGLPTPHAEPFLHVAPNTAYSGPDNPRPFFFLGAAYRSDLYAIGGHDEDFVYPGFDDNWLAECLIHGRKLQPRQWGDVIGYHLDHPRPDWIPAAMGQMEALLVRKRASGMYVASGGPWSETAAPRVSIICLIYKSRRLADWVYQSAWEFTPLLASGNAEFFFVANDATDDLLAHLRARKYPFVQHTNRHCSEHELYELGYGAPEYIHRVYRGYNEGIRRARGEIVVLVNSDHYFSPNWLEHLLVHAAPLRVVASQLVERHHPTFGIFPGALHADFGSSPADFRKDEWLGFCDGRSQNGLEKGAAFMPCALYKETAERVGLYPEGNIRGTRFDEIVRYGDQAFFAKLGAIGVDHVTASGSLVYHLKAGEIADPSP